MTQNIKKGRLFHYSVNLKMTRKELKIEVMSGLEHRFFTEIRKINEFLKLKPVRMLPKKIAVKRIELRKGYRIGSFLAGDTLIISSDLPEYLIDHVIKREAFIAFLPEVGFSQIYDLAWAYSGADPKWWEQNSDSIVDSLYYYTPAKHFPLLDERNKATVLKAITTYLRSLQNIRFDDYFSIYSLLMNRFLFQRLGEKESKVLEAILKGMNKLEDISRKTKLSPPTISRYLRLLRRTGVIFGPYNVNPISLGLRTVIVKVPNTVSNLSALRKFPFTYKIFRLATAEDIYATLLIPYDQVRPLLEKSRNTSLRVGVVKAVGYNFHKSDINLIDMIKSISTPAVGGGLTTLPKPSRPTGLTREDLSILNIVLDEGNITRDYLKLKGVKNADRKLRTLKEQGLIYKIYLPSGLGLGEQLFIELNVNPDQFGVFKARFSGIAPYSISYVSGTLRGIVGVILVAPEMVGDLMKLLAMAYPYSLKVASPIRDIPLSGWRIPVDHWDEKKQTFLLDLSWLLDEIK